MPKPTVLHASHRARGARMVDFGGWDMPLHYGSQVEEHHLVRRDAGMFDVSHMTVVDLRGAAVRSFLRRLVANSIDRLQVPGKALYACMLNAQGGVIDDLIVYFMAEDFFRVVVNAATRDQDLAWIEAQARAFGVVAQERPDLAMIAVQGPNARARFASLLAAQARAAVLALGRFTAVEIPGAQLAAAAIHGQLFVARTGYTGEDGFEVIVAEGDAVALWEALERAGVGPAGLGARDTLRLEAGMALYGQDMDTTVSPLEAGLGWTVVFDQNRDFIGRGALEAQKLAGAPRQTIGLVMDEKGVLRHGQPVHTESGVGAVLSGSFSPTLGRSIALARVPGGELGNVEVEIRGKRIPVRVVKYPFVREGQPQSGVLG